MGLHNSLFILCNNGRLMSVHLYLQHLMVTTQRFTVIVEEKLLLKLLSFFGYGKTEAGASSVNRKNTIISVWFQYFNRYFASMQSWRSWMKTFMRSLMRMPDLSSVTTLKTWRSAFHRSNWVCSPLTNCLLISRYTHQLLQSSLVYVYDGHFHLW